MTGRNYWLALFTGTTWQEFVDAGAEVAGFPERRWTAVQQIKPGDYLLCYLIRLSRFVGVLEVVSAPFQDFSVIWKGHDYPNRVRVNVVVSLSPETAVPVFAIGEGLSVLQSPKPRAWTGHFRSSPTKWKAADGELVVDALTRAQRNPTVRPFEPAKLSGR